MDLNLKPEPEHFSVIENKYREFKIVLKYLDFSEIQKIKDYFPFHKITIEPFDYAHVTITGYIPEK